MTISIPDELENFVSQQIQTGRFSDAQAVIVKALSAMREAEIIDASNDEQLRAAVQLGIDDLNHGRSEIWDPQSIKSTGRQTMNDRSAGKV